jgi:hypothetical protein
LLHGTIGVVAWGLFGVFPVFEALQRTEATMKPMKPRVLPDPARVRGVPKRFGWVDRRLVREGYVERCGTAALALYLVLATVADREGVSYYGDRSLCRMLRWTPLELRGARRDLRRAGLIAYRFPFYQVLGLDPAMPVVAKAPASERTAPEAERPATPAEIRAIIEQWKKGSTEQ